MRAGLRVRGTAGGLRAPVENLDDFPHLEAIIAFDDNHQVAADLQRPSRRVCRHGLRGGIVHVQDYIRPVRYFMKGNFLAAVQLILVPNADKIGESGVSRQILEEEGPPERRFLRGCVVRRFQAQNE